MHFDGALEDREYVRRASEQLLARIFELARQSELQLSGRRTERETVPTQPFPAHPPDA